MGGCGADAARRLEYVSAHQDGEFDGNGARAVVVLGGVKEREVLMEGSGVYVRSQYRHHISGVSTLLLFRERASNCHFGFSS